MTAGSRNITFGSIWLEISNITKHAMYVHDNRFIAEKRRERYAEIAVTLSAEKNSKPNGCSKNHLND
jgi:hypothetical protein